MIIKEIAQDPKRGFISRCFAKNPVKVVDLSMRITESLRVFPGSPQPCFVPWTTFPKHGYDSEAVFMSTHTGTHMDAPSHFIPGLPAIDKIPASKFVASALLVRIPKKANDLVEAIDFRGLDILENDAIVIGTGWKRRARARNYMAENPGLSAGAARYLVSKNVSAVAIDGPSIDAGQDSGFSAHKILLAKQILVIENLRNLGRLPDRFVLVIAPLKMRAATGSPVRALAVLGSRMT